MKSRTIEMSHVNGRRARNVLACVIGAMLGSTSWAAAAEFSLTFPAGVACDFQLTINGTGGHQVYREFLDRDGNLIRSLSAGTGSALTYINDGTGAMLSTKSNGADAHVTYDPDGSSTWVLTGHNVLIMFPTDTPPGPSTTLYVGRVVFTVDNGDTYLQQTSGRAMDICAALS